MKNTWKRALSLLLALTMVLSLGLPAYALDITGDDTITEGSFDAPIISDLPPVEAGDDIIIGDLVDLGDQAIDEGELELVALPAQEFNYADDEGFSVEVSAPRGALPAGVEMKVERLEELSRVQDAVDRAENLDGHVALAADISFWMGDEEIEPAEGTKLVVKLVAPEIEGIAEPIVVHIPDDENSVPEVVEQLSADEELLMADTVAFEAEDFSVYAIVDGGEQSNITLTVEFYDRGTKINTQIIRKDQINRLDAPVFDPGVPSINDKQSFEGWYLGETANYTEETVGYDVDSLNTYIKNTYANMTANATIKLHAMVFNVRYAVYHDQAGAVLKTQSFHVPAAESGSASVKISLPYVGFMDGQNFVGWILEKDVETDPETGDLLLGDYPVFKDNPDPIYENDKTYTLTDTVELYPYLRTGNWMVFDNYIDQDDDPTTASYTSPVFVNEGEATAAPATPTRTGYEFKGWFKDKGFTERFIFGSPISEDVTVYAKWEQKMTTYQVVFWQQNVTDAVDAADADKTYSFYKSEERGAKTGDPVSLIIEDSGTAADNRLGGNSTTSIGEMGFFFSYNEANSDTDSVVVKGDGSTVLNVYYDRKVITFNFYGDLTSYSYSSYTYNSNYPYFGYSNGSYFRVYRSGNNWYNASNTRYNGTVYRLTYTNGTSTASSAEVHFGSIQGLWFSTLESFDWNASDTISGSDWPYPGIYLMWHNEDDGRYTGKQFQYETGARNETTLNFFLNQYEVSSTTRPYTCLGQDASGSYTITLDEASLKSNETLYLNGEEYYGYRLSRYNYTTNNYNNATVWDGKEVSLSYNQIGSSGHAYFYFARNQWDFVYESNNSSVKTETVYWQGDLSGLASYVPTNGPDGYYFDGWYADSGFDTEFDFSQEMPNHSVAVYAKWTMMRFRVVLDPTGGEAGVEPSDITFVGNQATTFRVDYGELVQASSINNASREGYTLLGWYLDKEFTQPFNFANPITDTIADMTYATASDAQRQGVDPWNGNKTYNDADGEHDNVVGKVTIYAKWRQDPNGIIGINVLYLADDKDGNEGTFSDGTDTWNDPDIYADRAQAYAQPASTPDNNELQFLYWEILDREGNPTERKAYPGQTWEVRFEDAVAEDISTGDSGDLIPVDVYYTYADHINARRAEAAQASGKREVQTLTTTLFSDNFDDGTAFTTSTSSSDTMSTETWTAYKVGNGNNWENYNDSSYAHSGSRSARYGYNSYYAANCYLISKPFKISGTASAVNVSLYERVYSASWPETFEVFLIVTDGVTTNGAAVSATHYDVISSANYTNTTYAQKTGSPADLSALAGKNVRLVIHCTSSADMARLYIDDVNVTETKTGEAVTYELVDEPEAGKDYVIVVGDTHAVMNSVYANNRYINALSVVNNGDGTITFFADEESSLLYRAGGSASGWTFYNEAAGKYLGLNASDSHWLSMVSDSWEWLYTGTDLDNQCTDSDNVNSSGNAFRYLSYSTTYDDFTTSTGTGNNVKFYKEVRNGYTVTFVDGYTNEIIEEQTVEEGGSAIPPEAPDHTGEQMVFTGWDKPFDNVTEDITVTAVYVSQSSLSYTVTFHYMASNGEWISEQQTVQHGEDAIPPTVPTPPEGYIFNSWNKRFNNITSNLTIDAVYKQVATMKYTITLRAVYGRKTPQALTHIYWYANNGTTPNNGAGPREEMNNIPLNTGYNIPTPTTWTSATRDGETGLVYPGHVFLGWARVENESAAGTAAQAHPELTEADLYLKWVEEDNGGHFETKVGNEWKPVTKVAADEEHPYHDMYAVWAPVFYVYHTGDKTVERVMMPTGNATNATNPATFNLTELVDTSKFLYGGYYESYSGTTTDVSTLTWGAPVSDVTAICSVTASDELSALVTAGKISKTTDTNGTKYLGDGSTTFTTAYETRGDQITPVVGKVYYIKEVPVDDFLQPKMRFTYVASSGKIGTTWLFTNTDDTNYNEIGFVVDGTRNAGANATAVTIEPKTIPANKTTFYIGTEPTGEGNKTKLFDHGSSMNYLMVYNKAVYENNPDLNVGDEVDILKSGSVVYMYWITKDNMIVTSKPVRTYNAIEKVSTIAQIVETQTSTIVYNNAP